MESCQGGSRGPIETPFPTRTSLSELYHAPRKEGFPEGLGRGGLTVLQKKPHSHNMRLSGLAFSVTESLLITLDVLNLLETATTKHYAALGFSVGP